MTSTRTYIVTLKFSRYFTIKWTFTMSITLHSPAMTPHPLPEMWTWTWTSTWTFNDTDMWTWTGTWTLNETYTETSISINT